MIRNFNHSRPILSLSSITLFLAFFPQKTFNHTNYLTLDPMLSLSHQY